MRQVSAAMRSRRGASTHTQVRSYPRSSMTSASAHECLCLVSQGWKVSKADLQRGIERRFREDLTHTQGTARTTPTVATARHRRGTAQHGTAQRGCDRLGGDAHGSWSLPSHSRLGGDGEGAPAGGSAGGSKTELNSHSRYAPQCHSTSVASTEHGVTSSTQPVRDAYRCTGCAIATLTLVGCTAAREQRGSTTTRTRAT